MSEIWFTADTHFNHRNIIKYCERPYADVEEMNDALVNNFNEMIKPGDVLYHLGDVAMGPKGAGPISHINGVKHLISGNHESYWPQNKPSQMLRYLDLGFQTISSFLTMKIEGRIVHLSHFPYMEDERHEHKYANYHPDDDGELLVHGHVHTLWKERERQLNVGVDVWDMKPVHIDEIAAWVTTFQ